jgi:hypothetical protein
VRQKDSRFSLNREEIETYAKLWAVSFLGCISAQEFVQYNSQKKKNLSNIRDTWKVSCADRSRCELWMVSFFGCISSKEFFFLKPII